MATEVRLDGWPARGQALGRIGVAAQVQLFQAAAAVANELKTTAVALSPTGKTPHKGPRFRDSWLTVIEGTQGGASVSLGNTAPHAPYVLFLTRPHVITANHLTARGRPGFLRFEGSGGIVFRHSVNHPGTPGNPVHLRVDEQLQPRYAEIVRERAEGLAVEIQTVFR